MFELSQPLNACRRCRCYHVDGEDQCLHGWLGLKMDVAESMCSGGSVDSVGLDMVYRVDGKGRIRYSVFTVSGCMNSCDVGLFTDGRDSGSCVYGCRWRRE